MRRAKRWETTLAIFAALFASQGLAEDFKTAKGREYKNGKLTTDNGGLK